MTDAVEIRVPAGSKGFAEDKDEARWLRVNNIMPTLLAGKHVILDFTDVQTSTQSFVHALLAEPVQKIGEAVLERLEFRSCSPQLKTLIRLVVDYSLGGFATVAGGTPIESATQAAMQSKPRKTAKPRATTKANGAKTAGRPHPKKK